MEREKDARRGTSRAARYLPGARGPMGRGREPHLNLPEDVTTPRRTPGQWEAVTGRGGAPRNWAGPQRDSWLSLWPPRERGRTEPAAADAGLR